MSYRSAATLVLVLFIASLTAAAEESFSRLGDGVIEILRSRYQDVQLKNDSTYPGARNFARSTRDFIIYRLNKIGNWQKPMTVRGPDRGGLVVRFRVSKGQWNGALAVPHTGTKDLHVFKETHVIRDSKNGQWHIWAQILTPKADTPDEIQAKLIQIFNEFEKYEK